LEYNLPDRVDPESSRGLSPLLDSGSTLPGAATEAGAEFPEPFLALTLYANQDVGEITLKYPLVPFSKPVYLLFRQSPFCCHPYASRR